MTLRPVLFLFATALSIHCAGQLTLDERPCPCADGQVCCPGENVCRAASACSAGDDAGGAGMGGSSGGGGGSINPPNVTTLGGQYAVQVKIPVSWPQMPLVAAGAGVITFKAALNTLQDNTRLKATGSLCDLSYPDFEGNPSSAGKGQKWGFGFDASVFEKGQLTPFVFDIISSAPAPPAHVSSTTPFPIVVGTQFVNPLRDPWPATPSEIVSFDSDADGMHGVTLSFKEGRPYSSFPTAFVPGSPVTSKVGWAARIVVAIDGNVATSGNWDGSVAVVSINGKSAIDNHVVDCATANGSCTVEQEEFLRSQFPIYTPQGKATLAVRATTDLGCAAVRNVVF